MFDVTLCVCCVHGESIQLIVFAHTTTVDMYCMYLSLGELFSMQVLVLAVEKDLCRCNEEI